MRDLGIVQDGAPILRLVATPFDLPVRPMWPGLSSTASLPASNALLRCTCLARAWGWRAADRHRPSCRDRPARRSGGRTIVLLNPRIVGQSEETDEQYEGCLSFFDVHGLVVRPLRLAVEHADLAGARLTKIFEMRPGVRLIPVEQYGGTGTAWTY
jgi:peptide deformylase